MRKPITKRRPYKNRRRIIRGGGNIDDDAKQLIDNLKGLDRRSIITFLESIKTNPKFTEELKKRNEQFYDKLKSTCNYIKSFENFVQEMITTTINTLRNEQNERGRGLTQTSAPPPKITEDTIRGLLPENANLEALFNNFMDKYIAAKTGPCLSVDGTQMKRSEPGISKREIGNEYSRRLREQNKQKLQKLQKGGTRRKNKKSKRMRRNQRGGEFIIILGVIAAVAILAVIGYAAYNVIQSQNTF